MTLRPTLLLLLAFVTFAQSEHDVYQQLVLADGMSKQFVSNLYHKREVFRHPKKRAIRPDFYKTLLNSVLE